MGDINVFSGPMKCGKSMHILTEYNRQLIAGKNAMMFKPKLDTRIGENIVSTRDGKSLVAKNIERIDELKNYDADVYFIDEFQFLQGDVKAIEDLAEKGKKFFIAGLNLTSDKKPFGKMGDLMCIADNIKMMTSICEVCKNDNAVFSYFKGQKDTEIVLGDTEYIPVCRNCYEKLMKQKNKG